MKIFGKKKPHPPPPGVADYWAEIHVVLAEALPLYDSEGEPETPSDLVIDYFRNFGFRRTPSRIRAALTQAVEDGMIDWQHAEVSEARPFRELDRESDLALFRSPKRASGTPAAKRSAGPKAMTIKATERGHPTWQPNRAFSGGGFAGARRAAEGQR